MKEKSVVSGNVLVNNTSNKMRIYKKEVTFYFSEDNEYIVEVVSAGVLNLKLFFITINDAAGCDKLFVFNRIINNQEEELVAVQDAFADSYRLE